MKKNRSELGRQRDGREGMGLQGVSGLFLGQGLRLAHFPWICPESLPKAGIKVEGTVRVEGGRTGGRKLNQRN